MIENLSRIQMQVVDYSCPRPTNDAFRDRGLSQCEDYTTSGHFTKTNLDEDGKTPILVEFPTMLC